MENRKKSIEELQAELALESEALATLQNIYADKVKQVRTNTSLPSDIQARFLTEWENFYQQRVSAIFKKEYRRLAGHSNEDDLLTAQIPHSQVAHAPQSPVVQNSVQTVSSEPITPAVMASVPAAPPVPVSPPTTPAAQPIANPPAALKPPIIPPAPVAPIIKKNIEPPPPPPPPSLPMAISEPQALNDDILGVNTESWMNVAESISYEQYESEPISTNLMDSGKVESVDDNYNNDYMEENESIDGFAATSGLKGLTEFMDFDLKRKKS